MTQWRRLAKRLTLDDSQSADRLVTPRDQAILRPPGLRPAPLAGGSILRRSKSVLPASGGERFGITARRI